MRAWADKAWTWFRALPIWAQIPIGTVVAFFALGLVAAPFTSAEEGVAPETTTVPPPAVVTTVRPRTTLPVLPAGHNIAVTRISDGDTLVVSDGTRVRLIGIDAPESGGDCYSLEATNHLRGLIGPGTRVRLVYDAERLDRFGRTLAYVYRLSDGLFVNLDLARNGFAQQLTIPPNVRHAEDFRQAVADARKANRGLWSSCQTTATPAPATAPPAPPPTAPLPTDPPATNPPATDPTATDPPAANLLPTDPAPSDPPATDAPSACHSSYSGACVPIASDVDCGGGQGNGPEYVYEEDFQVVGPDVYGLDADHDGIGCESR